MNLKKKKIFKKIFDFYKNNKKLPKIDFHIHTNWTDGKHSVREMADAAQKRKLEMIMFTEHSRKSSKVWFNKFVREIKETQKKHKKCKMFIGTEVKIKDFDGSLDINNSIKKKCDYVMASVHRFPGEKGNIFKNKPKISKKDAINIEYKLSIRALKKSNFSILGHPFGMSLKRFKIQPDWKLFQKLIRECKKNNKIFEINFHYHKNYKKLLEECIKQKAYFSLGSNAHTKKDIGRINSF
jgi:putative hydrolase